MSDPISTKTQSELAALLARSFLYRLLAHLFKYPSLGTVRQFVSETRDEAREATDVLRHGGTGQLAARADRLYRVLMETDDREWVRQYESCFGHTANSRVPAYELEYGEEHSYRQPQELADITAFYQAFGLQISKESHERADHVGVECEFMQALLYKQAYAWARGEEEHAHVCQKAAHTFLSHHLGVWLPAFTFRLSRFAGEGALKEIADFAFQFVAAECLSQGVKMGQQDLPIRTIQEKEETGCVSCQLGPVLGTSSEAVR